MSALNQRLGVADGGEYLVRWDLDNAGGTARNQFGHTVRLRPFLGVIGMPADNIDSARFNARPNGGGCVMSVWLRHRIPAVNWMLRGVLGAVTHEEAPDRKPFKATANSLRSVPA